MAEAFDVSGVPCGPRPVIDYPGTETVEWYGFKRHNFELNGFSGFIVEPPNPAPGLPWTWCLQWAEALQPFRFWKKWQNKLFVLTIYAPRLGIAKVI